MQSRKAVGPALSALDLEPKQSDRFAYQNRFVPFIIRDRHGNPLTSVMSQAIQNLQMAPPPVTKPLKLKPQKGPHGGPVIMSSTTNDSRGGGSGMDRPGDDLELGGKASDFGVILLERTRMTPNGFALGEHLLSLSLAPAEEVTIEQKTFSERVVTFEDVNDTDEEITTEIGSNLTTELSEALSRVVSDTKNRGFNAGGSIGLSYYVNLNISAGYTDSISNALSTTAGETVRNVMTKTEKLASRRRAQHKVTMKVAETSRYETGNKRIIKNPNQFTPIDLVYFKILQKLKLSHERYGIRLCWAPFIPDPGIVLDQAENAERARLEGEIPLNLPVLRDRPLAPGAGMPRAVSSGSTELANWGQPWGDMRADYEFRIPVPAAAYLWDGGTISLTVTTTGFGARGKPSVFVVLAEPYVDPANSSSGVRAIIHAGADWGGSGAHLYCNVTANFVPDTSSANAAFQDELAKWLSEKDAHEKEVTRLKAERQAAIKTALATWRVSYLKTFDPVSTAYQLLVAMMFPPNQRDEGFEIEMWNKIFDFEATAFQYYPAWWSNRERRNPEKAADAFENASWMRVFLPIRPGFELQALNLLLDRRVFTQTTNTSKADAIRKLLHELSDARTRYFGGIDELELIPGTPCPEARRPYICLAHWDELLPTDGTHLEVVQALTTAIDDTSEQSLADAHQMMTAQIGNRQSEGALTTTLSDKVANSTTPPDVDLHVGLGTKRPE